MTDIFEKKHFGSYFQESLLVEINVEEEEIKTAIDSLLNNTVSPDPIKKDSTILNATAYLHEMRHFFDCFGTVAGLSIFGYSYNILKEFVNLSLQMRENGIRWELPVFNWYKKSNCPSEVKSFVKKATAIKKAVEIFKQPFEPFTEEGESTDYVAILSGHSRGEIKAFPVNVMSISSNRISHVYMPIGFETLLEGNALAIQREFLSGFSSGSNEVNLKRIAVANKGEQPIPTSYYITDLLITKYIKKFGFSTFPRNVIHKLTDMCLNRSRINQYMVGNDVAVEMEKTDLIFFELMESFSVSDISNGTINHSEEDTKTYELLLEDYNKKIRGVEEIENQKRSPANSIELMGRYIFHNIIKPSLEERLDSNHQAFTTYEGFLKLLNKTKFPPFLAVPSGIKRTVNDSVFYSWMDFIVFQCIMNQILSNKEVILCPRANRLIPGLHNINMSFKETCDQWIRRGCGRWYEGTFNELPPCLFNESLKVLSIKE